MLWIVSGMGIDTPGSSASSSAAGQSKVNAEVEELLLQLQSHCEVALEVLKLLRHLVESVAHSEGSHAMMESA